MHSIILGVHTCKLGSVCPLAARFENCQFSLSTFASVSRTNFSSSSVVFTLEPFNVIVYVISFSSLLFLGSFTFLSSVRVLTQNCPHTDEAVTKKLESIGRDGT